MLAILRRPGHDWPLIIAANRDERLDRSWEPPGRHWPDRPDIIGGLDVPAGGSWMAINDHGVVAAILNRTGSLGPAPGKRSRGEIVLDALDHADAADAAEAMTGLDPNAYRSFNLVVADDRDAFWLAHREDGKIVAAAIPTGLSMLTERDLDDRASPRVGRHIDRFRAAAAPDPGSGDWAAWQALLEDETADSALGPQSAMRFRLSEGFGTVAGSLLALPRHEPGRLPIWRFARFAGQPSGWSLIRPN
jgi:uncharacterized protein with NRDE domain